MYHGSRNRRVCCLFGIFNGESASTNWLYYSSCFGLGQKKAMPRQNIQIEITFECEKVQFWTSYFNEKATVNVKKMWNTKHLTRIIFSEFTWRKKKWHQNHTFHPIAHFDRCRTTLTHTHAQTHGSAKTLRRKMNPKNNKRSKTYNFH